MGTLANEKRLEGVKPALVTAIKLGVSRLSFNCTVSEGVRSREAMMVNYGKGRTVADCAKWGIPARYAKPNAAKVTWLTNPFASKHGDGSAVDVYPLVNGKLANTKDHLPLFRALYEAVIGAARETNTKVRYGGDWDQDSKLFEQGETDAVHFELIMRPRRTLAAATGAAPPPA